MRKPIVKMSKNTPRTCVVLRTHFVDAYIYNAAYLPLQNSLPEHYHMVVAHDQTKNGWSTDHFPVSDLLVYDEETMQERNALHKNNWYNFESLLSHIYEQRSGFDYYWIIEYDVRFSGDWASFFSQQDRNSEADALLTNGIWPFNGDHNWWVWHELEWGEEKPVSERYAGFVFLGRYSSKLMQCVHDQIGIRSGYAEVYLATLCNEFGFSTAAIDKQFHGSTCVTNAAIDSHEYAQREQSEPNKIFHKVLGAKNSSERTNLYEPQITEVT